MSTRFLEHANLPKNRVSLVCAQNSPKIIKELNKLGIDVLFTDENKLSDNETSRHADMQMCHLAKNTVYADMCCINLIDSLKKHGFCVTPKESAHSPYPNDVLYNLALLKDKVVCAQGFAQKDLLITLKNSGFSVIDVKQGYAKCSLCIIDENSFITEDEGIAEKLKKNGADVLLISKGGVYLSDKHCGFFGGASGKISKDVLAVTGSLDTLADCLRIKAFAKSKGVTITELTKDKIIDIGGILPLKEEEK